MKVLLKSCLVPNCLNLTGSLFYRDLKGISLNPKGFARRKINQKKYILLKILFNINDKMTKTFIQS